MSKKKEIIINLSVLAATVIVFMILLEAYFRILSPQTCYAFPKGIYEESSSLCYKLSPNTEGEVSQPEYSVTYTVNSKGLRDSEYAYEKAQTKRIIALGDSFQFGHGVEKNETYTELLEINLNNEGKNAEILNFGIPGYGTRQQLEYLKAEGLKYHPDLIILSFFTEDLFDNLQDACTRYVRDGYLVDNATAEERTASFRMKLFLNQKVQSYCFLKNSYLKLPSSSKKYTGRIGIEGTAVESMKKNQTEQIKKAWTKTSVLLAQMTETAKQNNATLIIVIIPHQVQVDNDIWNGVKNAYNLNENDYSRSLPNEQVKQLGKELGITVIDLLPGLTEENNKKKLYYPIDGHFNPEGQKKASEIAHNELKGII